MPCCTDTHWEVGPCLMTFVFVQRQYTASRFAAGVFGRVPFGSALTATKLTSGDGVLALYQPLPPRHLISWSFGQSELYRAEKRADRKLHRGTVLLILSSLSACMQIGGCSRVGSKAERSSAMPAALRLMAAGKNTRSSHLLLADGIHAFLRRLHLLGLRVRTSSV